MAKIWIDDICQLFNADFNPIGAPINTQLNILTKFILLFSTATSLKKGNFKQLKRTILYITLVMFLYICLHAILKNTPTISPAPKQVPGISTEEFTNATGNPVGNPMMKTNPLSSPATGPTQTLEIAGPASTSRILGCSLNTRDWSGMDPEGNTAESSETVDILGKKYSLSPDIEQALTHNMPMDPSDEFYGPNYSRQIYKIADDQNNYAESLYAQGPEQQCKQGSVFAHLGNPYTVYTQSCSPNNGYGESRRTGIYLKNN